MIIIIIIKRLFQTTKIHRETDTNTNTHERNFTDITVEYAIPQYQQDNN